MSRRGRPKAQAKAKVAPTPPAVLPRTTQPAQPAQRAEVPQSTQPPPSNWNRAAFTWILIAIIAPRAIPLSPASAFRCLNHVTQWQHLCGFWWAVEIGVAECVQSNNIPLVSVVLQYGTTLPYVYPYYESQTALHRLMLETAKRPEVSAFYAEAGMGKSTVAAAVLRELHDQNVPAAFVTFEVPGELKLKVATALQTIPDRLSHDLHGALLQLKDRGFRKAVLVIDAVDEHKLTRADEDTIKALAGVSWELLTDHHIHFAVICLIRTLETKKRFAQMNGGHKITDGLATEACPNVSTETLRSYASQLNATGDFEKWTNEAPYLIVVRHFADGWRSMAEVVQQYKERCSGVIVHELDNTPLPSAGQMPHFLGGIKLLKLGRFSNSWCATLVRLLGIKNCPPNKSQRIDR